MTEPLLHSFVIGFLAASPIGPIGLVCMRRAIVQGCTSGIISALGIACAYSFWAFATIHGLAAFSDWIEMEHRPLELAIGLFFGLYGLHEILNQPKTEYPTLQSDDRLQQFFSTFLVVFLNPATFVLFTVFFTVFGIAEGQFDFLKSAKIASLVFIGAVTFWILALYIIHRIRDKIGNSIFRIAARVSAFGITAFGIAIFLSAILDLS